MTTVARWTPMRNAFRLQDELNRLLDPRAFVADSAPVSSAWAPPVDIYEDAEGITLRAELPGLSAQDIDVRVENNTLTLKGERKLEREETKQNYRRIERSYGAFTRAFALPPNVDTDKVRAESRDGVLHVFLPRREETKPKQIKIAVQ
jgi:HSP20 family protein